MSDLPVDRSRRDLLALAPAASLTLTAGSSVPTREAAPADPHGIGAGGEISVARFGARGDGSVDDHPAITAAVAEAVGRGCDLILPAGVYRLDRTLELGFAGLRVFGRGKVILRFIGTGPAVSADAGEDRILYDHHLHNLLIVGDGSPGQEGLLLRNIAHATRRDLRVTGIAGTAFRIAGDVLSVYDRCRVADNETSRSDVVPQVDFHVTGTRLNKATTACLFVNCMAERARRVGWDVERCDDSRWIGGTAEGVEGIGLRIGREAAGNSFESFFLEHNAQGDIVCAGRDTSFRQCNATSAAPTSPYERIPSLRVATGARGTRFEGGRAFSVVVEPGAANTGIAHADIAYRIDDRGIATIVRDCRQGYQSDTRYPGMTLGNVDDPNPVALDWYREAAFTPVLADASGRGRIDHAFAQGRSTRIGNIVFVTITIRLAGASVPASTGLVVGGLPYASARGVASVLPVAVSGGTAGVSWIARTDGNDRLRIVGDVDGRDFPVTAAAIVPGLTVIISGQYMV